MSDIINELAASATPTQLTRHNEKLVAKALELTCTHAREVRITAAVSKIEESMDSRVLRAKADQYVAALVAKSDALLGLSETDRSKVQNAKAAIQAPTPAKDDVETETADIAPPTTDDVVAEDLS